jgi:hypothetical protein
MIDKYLHKKPIKNSKNNSDIIENQAAEIIEEKANTGDSKKAFKQEYCINIRGNFCSPNCVMSHIMIYTRDMSERLNKISMLKFVYELFTGVSINDIQPSPSHTEMVQYGGNKTSQDYQKKIDELGSNYMKLKDSNFISNCKLFINKFISD